MPPHLEEAGRLLRVAARDLKALQVLKAAPDVDVASVGFHAQQAVEKSLKAVLYLHHVTTQRTHDLVELRTLLEQHGIEPPVSLDQLGRLNPFAVTLRYDDMVINIVSREEASEWALLIYGWASELVQAAMAENNAPDND